MKKKGRYKGTKVHKKTKSPYDRHHLLWMRNEWNKGELDRLRLYPYCIIEMDRDTIHRYLHNHLACIPTPKECSIERVLFQLNCLMEHDAISLDDPIEKRLSVLIALFECSEQPTADALREQLRLIHEYKKAPTN